MKQTKNKMNPIDKIKKLKVYVDDNMDIDGDYKEHIYIELDKVLNDIRQPLIINNPLNLSQEEKDNIFKKIKDNFTGLNY